MSQNLSHTNGQEDHLPSQLPFRIVGIGASAGGLESLEKFFRALPDDTDMAFVVVQHLSPDFKSMMDELLARHTAMPIRIVEDGMLVKPNKVYLLPPNKEMTILDGRLRLTGRDPNQGLTLPIDIFLRSLAQNGGACSAAIILSGTGSDGSKGIREIAKAGGLVLSESASSAKFDGMPRSAEATGVVHFIAEPQDMPKLLMQKHSQPLNRGDDRNENDTTKLRLKGKEAIFDLLRREYRIDFDHYKPTTIERRIERRLLMGPHDLDQYAERLRDDPYELNLLYHDLLIGVTAFFRDAETFERLEHDILPGLIERAPETEEIRAWVAGCATGEEAYSLAILLHEALDRFQRPLNVKILATDVHKLSLEHANRGIYEEERTATVSSPRLRRYFTKKGSGYQVSQDLRQMIVFAQHNVIHDAPFTNLDLITCRNLLIYFQPPAQKKALTLFHFGLKKGSVLLLGSSETPGELAGEFETLDEHSKLYRKRRDVKLPADMRLPLSTGNREARRPRILAAPLPTRGPDLSLLQTYDDLLERYMPPGFLVNEHRELLHCFGNAEKLLKPRKGRPSNDLLDLVDAETKTVIAGALQRAIRQQQPIHVSGISLPFGEGDRQTVRLAVELIPTPQTQLTHYLITIEPLRKPTGETETVENVELRHLTNDRIQDMEEELRYTKENLQTMIEEQETANEELQATNEELVASNEELQSTNEELHSVNEELYTVNAEHQSKIQELAELNRDMNHLLEGGDIATLFLDRDLCIRRFTPRVGDVFDLIEQDVGRKIATFKHRIRYDQLLDDLERVLADDVSLEREVRDADNCCFFLRMFPYHVAERVEGVVLSLVDISALDQARGKIEHLSSIVESSDDAILSKDLNGIITSWNRGAERLYGYTASEAIGQPVVLIVPESHRSEVQRLLECTRNGQRATGLETKRQTKSGQILDVSLTVSPLYGNNDEVIGASAIGRDISDLKRIQREKEDQEERLRLLLASTAEAIYGIDTAGRCTFCNPACAQMLGFESTDDLLGQEMHSLIHHTKPDGSPYAVEDRLIYRAFQVGEELHCEDEWLWRADGTKFRAEIWSHPVVKAGRSVGAVVTFLDVTDRKVAEETLQQSESRFRDTFENAAVGVAHVDLEGRWLRVNDRFCEITGYSAGELLDKSFHDLTHPEDLENDVGNFQQLLEGEISHDTREKRYLRKDGATIWIQLTASVSWDGANRPLYVIAVIQDITDRKLVEDQIRRSVKQRDEFLAMMSHELRNPLSAARTATTLLATEGVDPQIEVEARRVLNRQMAHMTRLLDDLLDVSRFTTGKLQMQKECIDLCQVIQEAVEAVSAVGIASEVGVKTELTDEPIWIQADAHRMQQAIGNLVTNAIKYSPSGEEVIVRVEPDGDQVLIRVIDNGIGIAPEMLDSIFEMFVQSESTLDRSCGGMGLGLTLVRLVVLAHQGTVEARSAGGGLGSEFQVRLPRIPVPRQKKVTDQIEESTARFKRILLVEDQEDARRMLCSLLRIEGFHVADYGDPVEALKRLDDDQPDAAILDIGLPIMSGYDLAGRLRERIPTLFLIALTGYGQSEDISLANQAGFDHHLVKPLKPEELSAVLNGKP